jgi:hypothetical protein
MKHIFTFLLSLLSLSIIAQEKTGRSFLQLGLGYSTHGTGDMKGVAFSVEYARSTGRRMELGLNIRSTIHGDAFKVTVNKPDGSTDDASFRYSNAGLQAGPVFGYRLLQSAHHQFRIQAGTFARYQNSTLPSMYSFFIDQSSGMPRPSFEFLHDDKQNTFAAGYSVDLAYDFITTKKMMFGIKAGFQNDTNGDAITQVCLTVGKKFL